MIIYSYLEVLAGNKVIKRLDVSGYTSLNIELVKHQLEVAHNKEVRLNETDEQLEEIPKD